MKKNNFFTFFLAFLLITVFPATAALAGQSLLKQGMSGNDVLDLQVKLKKTGYYQGNPDGYFGPATRNAIINFQTQNGLTADGIAGPKTLQALQNLSSAKTLASRGSAASQVKALKQGMQGDDVLKLQANLQRLGYYCGTLDGDFGPATLNAVINFQMKNGLTVDGIAGPDTLRALQTQNPAVNTTNRGLSGDRKSQAIVSFAKQFLGTRYVWGGNSPAGFDCSGFTSYIFGQYGINLPHAADQQFNTGIPVKQPGLGDLVFFSTYEPGPSHVGIYIGNDQFIHASSAAGEVCITPLSTPYYRARYLGTRSVIN